MIKISIKLDKRYRLINGKFPLKFKVARKDSAFYISTGYELKEGEWDGKAGKVKTIPGYKAMNIKLNKRLNVLNDKIINLQEEGKLRLYSNKKLLLYLTNSETEEEAAAHLFKTQADEFIKTKQKQNTIYIYKVTEERISSYCDYETLRLEDIDIEWLDGFVMAQKQRGNKTNSIAMRLRNIKTIINYAKKKGLISDYVFDNYRIKIEDTEKRSLTVEQLRILYNAELSAPQRKHRDIFFLIFFLMGINMIDLSQLTEIKDGRISYRRSKTSTLYDIKIEKEALEIINRYRGKEHLLSIFDNLSSYKYYEEPFNKIMGKISKSLGLPRITAYWARHTFASIAYEIDIPMDIIAACLGHKSAHKITEIYVRKDQQKVDKANRRVIDYVLYNKREQ